MGLDRWVKAGRGSSGVREKVQHSELDVGKEDRKRIWDWGKEKLGRKKPSVRLKNTKVKRKRKGKLRRPRQEGIKTQKGGKIKKRKRSREGWKGGKIER